MKELINGKNEGEDVGEEERTRRGKGGEGGEGR